MRGLKSLATVAYLLAGHSGCDSSEDVEPIADEAFDDAVSVLQESHGDGKADLFGLSLDPCLFLEPLLDYGEPAIQMGYFVGIQGDGVIPGFVGSAGYDVVWDLYHHQLSAHRYSGVGFTSSLNLGGGVTAYAGMAFNFQNGVHDWWGHFGTASANFGVPFFRDYASLSPAVFVSGVDLDEDGYIDSVSEIDPYGVSGFSVGVTSGLSIIPDPLPVSGTLSSARWTSYDPVTRELYNELADVDISWAPDPVVRLVEVDTGADCLAINPQWPEPPVGDQTPQPQCVIELGDPDASHVRRSVDDALAMCHFSAGCQIPLAWPTASTALAIGLFRDGADKIRRRCMDD